MSSIAEQRAAIRRARLAQAAASELQSFLQNNDDEELKVAVAGRAGDRTVVVPRSAGMMLAEILEALGRGSSRALCRWPRS
jgi:hypothetical protein